MNKAFLIPPETFKETLPTKFKSILVKVKKICWDKKIPIIFDIPKNLNPEKDFIAITNIDVANRLFKKDNPFIKVLSPSQIDFNKTKFYEIKPNMKFLPMTAKQKILLTTATFCFVASVVTGFFFTIIPALIFGLIPFIQNYVPLERFSWANALNWKVNPEYSSIEEEDIFPEYDEFTSAFSTNPANPIFYSED